MNEFNIQKINEELSKIPCPKHHQIIVLERFYYGKPKFSNVCCKEHELACAKLVCSVAGEQVVNLIEKKATKERI